MCAIEYYSYDDYKDWEGRWELIAGSPLAMSPSPVISHQAIAVNIAYELKDSMGECENCLVVMEEDWKIEDDTVVKPDISLICDEPGESYITKAPELIVEVISPTTAKRDEKTKFRLYKEEKVSCYIIIYPEDCKAKVYRLRDREYDKVGDFSSEVYETDELSCNVAIDFERVFKRFRK